MVDKQAGGGDGNSGRDGVSVHPQRHRHHHKHKYHRGSSVQATGREELTYEGYVQTCNALNLDTSEGDIRKVNTSNKGKKTNYSLNIIILITHGYITRGSKFK